MPVSVKNQLEKTGLRIGHVGPALQAMPTDRLNALLDESARTGLTFAQVLAKHWSAA